MHKEYKKYDSAEMLQAIEALDRRDYKSALDLLIPLANSQNPKAQCNLADLYYAGFGVRPDGRRAAELYLTVAEQNIVDEKLSALAYHNLSVVFGTGGQGLDPDPEKSRCFAQRARDLGFDLETAPSGPDA